jgi:hypothetical protein
VPWIRLLVAALTTEARVRARVSLCENFGGQGGTGTGFSLSPSVFSCQCHSTVAFHIHISLGDEQLARWWPQFRDIVSPHRYDNPSPHLILSQFNPDNTHPTSLTSIELSCLRPCIPSSLFLLGFWVKFGQCISSLHACYISRPSVLLCFDKLQVWITIQFHIMGKVLQKQHWDVCGFNNNDPLVCLFAAENAATFPLHIIPLLECQCPMFKWVPCHYSTADIRLRMERWRPVMEGGKQRMCWISDRKSR